MWPDVVILLPPIRKFMLCVFDIRDLCMVEQLLLHRPVEPLDLALGLRMLYPAMDRKDVQIHEPSFESGVSLPEPGELAAVVRKDAFRHPIFLKYLKKRRDHNICGA